MTNAIAETAGGKVRGLEDHGLHVFCGVPYAEAPAGGLRFRPPQPRQAWARVRDCVAPGISVPQLPSRLEAIMGAHEHSQDDDSLHVTVWTPSVDEGGRPVLVWIHGGGYVSGSGSWPCYRGAQLAQRGDLVVVNVNYRLGAFGFGHLRDLLGDGYGTGNIGLLDQRLALEWIRDNVAAFGGDPSSITVMGQSAGGGSIAAHLTSSPTPLFRRAILLSAALIPPLPRDDATRIASRFCDELDRLSRGAARSPRSASVRDILAAQGAVLGGEARAAAQNPSRRWDIVPPFVPVRDGDVLTKSPIDELLGGGGHDCDLLIGFTSDEMAGFHALRDDMASVDSNEVDRAAEAEHGPAGPELVAELRAKHGEWEEKRVLREVLNRGFTDPSLRLAHTRTAHARPAFAYRFDWTPPAGRGFGGTHCVDLPFLFGNYPDWRHAGMLDYLVADDFDGISRPFQDAVIAFARTGDPQHTGLPNWPAYDADEEAVVMSFDRNPVLLSDVRPLPAAEVPR